MTDKTFSIELSDGEKYNLKYTNRALYEFETVHGTPAMNILMRGSMGVRAITHFVWAGLIHEHKSITIDEVKDLVPINDLQRVVNCVMDAMEHATDTGKSGKAKKKGKQSK